MPEMPWLMAEKGVKRLKAIVTPERILTSSRCPAWISHLPLLHTQQWNTTQVCCLMAVDVRSSEVKVLAGLRSLWKLRGGRDRASSSCWRLPQAWTHLFPPR